MAYITPKQTNAAGRYPGFLGMGSGGQFIQPKPAQRPGGIGLPLSNVLGVGPGTSPNAPAAPAPQAPQSSSLYDPSTDPVLQQIHALGQRNVSDAVASADALRKQLLIQYGDPALARSTLFGDLGSGITGDENTALAADQNPFSTLKTLLQGHTRNQQSIDNAANANNTYYGSVHANTLGDENQAYLHNLADSSQSIQDQLGGIVGQLLAAHNAADQANVSALNDATSSAIQQAIANGYSFGGYDAAGNPILTPPAGGGGASAATQGAQPGITPLYQQVQTASGGTPPAAPPSPAITGALAGIGAGNVTPPSTGSVGATNASAIYRLLGRKTDPRYVGV